MRDINVKQRIMPHSIRRIGRVFRSCCTGRVPEIGPVRFEDAGAGTYDVSSAELLISYVKGVVEVGPFHDIGFDEHAAGLSGVVVDEFLCFGTQAEVGDDDVAIVGEEEFGEAVIDALRQTSALLRFLS